jgi:hypothetical protein
MPNVNPGETQLPASQQPGNSGYSKASVPSISVPDLTKITNAIIILLMILVITVIAGFDEKLGDILVVFMTGVLLMWFLGPGSGELQKWISPVEPQNPAVQLA